MDNKTAVIVFNLSQRQLMHRLLGGTWSGSHQEAGLVRPWPEPVNSKLDDGWCINALSPFLLSLCITQIGENKCPPSSHTHTHTLSPHATLPVLILLIGLMCCCVAFFNLDSELSFIKLTQMALQTHYIITSGLHRQPFTFLQNDKRDLHHQSRSLYFPLCSPLFYTRISYFEVFEINK